MTFASAPRSTWCPWSLRGCVSVLALSVVSVGSRTAMAREPTGEDLTAARALFAEAEVDEQAGRWADALGKLRRASSVKMTPGLHFHLALCEEKLGQLVLARADYTAAQEAARAENNREVLQLVAAPLLALKVRMPTLTALVPSRFASGPGRAEVLLDGVALAPEAFGTPVPVDVGSHTLQATAKGQLPYAMTITLVEHQAATVDIRFVPMPGSEPAATAVVPSAGGTSAVVGTAQTAEGPHRGEAVASAHARTLAVVASGGTVALLGAGIGAYALAGSDQSTCAEHPTSPCGNRSAIRAWDWTALSLWVASAGVGAFAVTLWAKPTESRAVHAELGVGPGAVSLRGTF